MLASCSVQMVDKMAPNYCILLLFTLLLELGNKYQMPFYPWVGLKGNLVSIGMSKQHLEVLESYSVKEHVIQAPFQLDRLPVCDQNITSPLVGEITHYWFHLSCYWADKEIQQILVNSIPGLYSVQRNYKREETLLDSTLGEVRSVSVLGEKKGGREIIVLSFMVVRKKFVSLLDPPSWVQRQRGIFPPNPLSLLQPSLHPY